MIYVKCANLSLGLDIWFYKVVKYGKDATTEVEYPVHKDPRNLDNFRVWSAKSPDLTPMD